MNKRQQRVTILAVLVVLALVGLAVYGISYAPGNGTDVAACRNSDERVARLQGLNTGQVAAFQLAETPLYVGDLAFDDETGASTGLSAHRGQTVLLNLWATWCVPCREEMPALAELQEELGGADFQVLPVSVDVGGAQKPREFYEEHAIDALPFRHEGSLAVFNALKKQGIAFGMPVTVLVDAEGCALGWMNGPAEWASRDARALVGAAIAAEDGNS